MLFRSTAELQSDMEIKQAEAQKKSAIGQNNAAKEVAESNAELEVTKAEASRKAAPDSLNSAMVGSFVSLISDIRLS